MYIKRLTIITLINYGLLFSSPLLAENSDQHINQLTTKKDNGWLAPTKPNEGFLEGGHFNIFTRNWFEIKELRHGQGFSRTSSRGTVHKSGYTQTWAQGTQFIYESGFTQGLIGVGIDLSPFVGIRLDGGDGHAGFNSDAVPHHNSDGTPYRSVWSKMGVYDLKLKANNTVLKIGQQIVNNPFLAPHDNKTLPPSFQGFSLASTDLKDISLEAGSFNRMSRRADTSTRSTKLNLTYSGITVDRFSYLGVNWAPFKNTSIDLYASEAQNVYRQYYFNITHSLGDIKTAKWTLGFNDYLTKDHNAPSKVGHISNNTWSAQISAQHNAHTFMVGYQQVNSNEYFDYLNETSMYLANTMDMDYNAPHERSLQLRYNIDLGYYGVEGVNLLFWRVKGWGLDGTHYKGPIKTGYYSGMKELHGISHYENGFTGSYKVPSGKFKDITFKVIYMMHRGPIRQMDGNGDQLRLITEVPINVF